MTLKELDTYWSIDDLADAHDALDEKQEMELKAIEKAKGGK